MAIWPMNLLDTPQPPSACCATDSGCLRSIRTAAGHNPRSSDLTCRPVANQAGWGGGPIGGVLREESELNGVGADSVSQKDASSLDHILGLVADQRSWHHQPPVRRERRP